MAQTRIRRRQFLTRMVETSPKKSEAKITLNTLVAQDTAQGWLGSVIHGVFTVKSVLR